MLVEDSGATPGSGAESGMSELRAVVRVLDLDEVDVWLAYFSVGGNAMSSTVAAWLAGTQTPTAADYNHLAAGLNDELRERNLNASIPYLGRSAPPS